MIDLTWASPCVASRVAHWRVLTRYETLSDHKYVMFSLQRSCCGPTCRDSVFPSWKTRCLDRDLFLTALTMRIPSSATCSEGDSSSLANWLTQIVTSTCDTTIPRRKVRRWNDVHTAYWWTDGLARIQTRCSAIRRAIQRLKRSHSSLAVGPVMNHLLNKYRLAKRD